MPPRGRLPSSQKNEIAAAFGRRRWCSETPTFPRSLQTFLRLFSTPTGTFPLYVKALYLRINRLGCPLKSGRYFGSGLSGLHEPAQLLCFVGGPPPSLWYAHFFAFTPARGTLASLTFNIEARFRIAASLRFISTAIAAAYFPAAANCRRNMSSWAVHGRLATTLISLSALAPLPEPETGHPLLQADRVDREARTRRGRNMPRSPRGRKLVFLRWRPPC
jgi:hypothetical protein